MFSPRQAAARRRARDMAVKHQGGLCCYCRRRMDRGGCGSPLEATLEHLTPIAKGGGRGAGNLAAACRTCNQAKGDLTEAEFREVLAEFNHDAA